MQQSRTLSLPDGGRGGYKPGLDDGSFPGGRSLSLLAGLVTTRQTLVEMRGAASASADRFRAALLSRAGRRVSRSRQGRSQSKPRTWRRGQFIFLQGRWFAQMCQQQ